MVNEKEFLQRIMEDPSELTEREIKRQLALPINCIPIKNFDTNKDNIYVPHSGVFIQGYNEEMTDAYLDYLVSPQNNKGVFII